MRIYKYISPENVNKVFAIKGTVSFKCDYPKNYNDPFELFLTVNTKGVDPKYIAYYHEIIGSIPQIPTSCFSKRPDIIPMWAHYAKEHSGVVVEIDEELLLKSNKNASVGEVEYTENTGTVDLETVKYACETAKFRHTALIQRSALRSAYFTKNQCWSYEFEKRVLVQDDGTKVVDGKIILELPGECVLSIISGPKSSKETEELCSKISKDIDCNYYKMILGKASAIPYFEDLHNNVFVFDNKNIIESDTGCENCGEPTHDKSISLCHWCTTNEKLEHYAASRNPMRILAHLGMLEDYIKEF